MHDPVAEIRCYGFRETTVDGEMLALVALLRCAHLLAAMDGRELERGQRPRLSLRFRDRMEIAPTSASARLLG